MNALEDNRYTRGWNALGRALPAPSAILAISAHWFVPAVAVTAMEHPPTIHDFGGFPKELFAYEYPAPGAPQLAERVAALLAPLAVARDHGWGLDNGTWSVLAHVYPGARVPVVQLSIDRSKPAAFHYEIGRRLAVLRDENVLIVGSGNVVHNLRAYAWGEAAEPLDWAQRFDAAVRGAIARGDDAALVAYEALGNDARLSAPTPEHFLPLLYVLGARRDGDPVAFPIEGIDGGSISMLSVQIG